MSVSPAIIHIESPYVLRNLRDLLLKRRAEVMEWFRTANDWEAVCRVNGRLNGIEDALNILDELERKERN